MQLQVSLQRTLNAIQIMFDEDSPSQTDDHCSVSRFVCLDKLEDAQEAYIESITEDVDDATMNASDEPTVRYQAVVKSYTTLTETVSIFLWDIPPSCQNCTHIPRRNQILCPPPPTLSVSAS